MPLYLYENKKTGEVVEVLQGMKELHEYSGIDNREKGLWRRVYVNPTLSVDTQVDAFDSHNFANSVSKKNDSYGDLFERSAEASKKRAERYGGKDPVKEKYYSDYNKMTNGKLHPQQQKEKFNKAVEKADKAGIKIEL
tara:strand:+ start:847 stop:1260 length:414 start_codon:yes stop_codon:yes gene_type:complete